MCTSGRDRSVWSRRQFIAGAAAMLAVGGTGLAGALLARTRLDGYPFALGVASGDPSSDGFVLWTRIATATTDAAFLPFDDVEVEWLVAADESFTRVVRRGRAIARAGDAHAVHVEVAGLDPDRWYWYRFRTREAESPSGRTRTLPLAGAPTDRLRLALASCQHYEHGWYAAYRHLAADAPDLVVHVGDYIYEGSWGAQVRRHDSPLGARTLADYRNRHACYKGDPDLQRAHAACPWLVTWDDHEVSNDYAGAVSAYGEAPLDFAARRAAAYRAYCEHMPLRASTRASLRLYRRFAFGDLVAISLLDDRSWRAPHACTEYGETVPDAPDACPQRFAASQTLLGEAQSAWLERSLAAGDARWNVVAQQTLLAPFRTRGDDGAPRAWSDGWDGYPRSRARLLDTIAGRGTSNVVTLGGDVHAFFACDLKADFDDEHSATLATEFVGTSISSAGDDHAARVRDLDLNPHVRAYDGRWRGYLRCDVDARGWRSDFVAIDDATDPASGARTLQSAHVEDGRAGVQY